LRSGRADGTLGPVKAVVLADTHVHDGATTRLPARAWQELASADLILHAGDVVGPAFLAELGALAPVHAVLGNNDAALAGMLSETLELNLAGVSVAVVHDSGPRPGREGRLHRRFPDADVVVFGHSHIPWNAPGAGGQLLFNPGSATQRRRQPTGTIGVLHLDAGSVRAEIVAVE
jgi:putative phosphoesterase